MEPPERPEEERRLGLDALDRRDDEDRAVEHAEDAFDLGDEVGVAGRVDEVDREVAHEERGDRGPDRDAALALELERVGLGGAGVDAADVIDRAGGEEESFAEGGLTGVDVGEDSEIERAHGASCLPRRWSPSGWTWVLPCRSFLSLGSHTSRAPLDFRTRGQAGGIRRESGLVREEYAGATRDPDEKTGLEGTGDRSLDKSV